MTHKVELTPDGDVRLMPVEALDSEGIDPDYAQQNPHWRETGISHPIGQLDPMDPGVTVTDFEATTGLAMPLVMYVRLCSVCHKPGRFTPNGKGALAGKHRRCHARVTYRPSLWRRVVRMFEFWRTA